MSLRIDCNSVRRVLLADGWHDATGFDLDAYEFMDGDGMRLHGGGQSGVCATGFAIHSKGIVIAGPLTAILAGEYAV